MGIQVLKTVAVEGHVGIEVAGVGAQVVVVVVIATDQLVRHARRLGKGTGTVAHTADLLWRKLLLLLLLLLLRCV